MAKVSNDYATALFALALETDSLEETRAGLALAQKLFRENPEYPLLLSSPSIPKSERLAALDGVFADALPEYPLSFLKLLCEGGRIREFSACALAFEELYRAHHNIKLARIHSAAPLTEEEKDRLVAALSAKNGCRITAEYRVDPTLLGGILVEMDGKQTDGTLRRRLQEMKEVMNR